MKYSFLIICLLFFVGKSLGQDSITREQYKIQLIDSYKSECQVKVYLKSRKAMLKLMSHVLICGHEVLDTLKYMTEYTMDITNINEFLESDSTWIYLRNSYSWNIEKDLPFKPKLSNLKLLLKREHNYTEEERKLLNYLNFYSNPCDSLLDRFIYYQNFSLQKKRLIQVVFEIELKDQLEIELLRINEIKN